MDTQNAQQKLPHIAMVPSPGMGHLIPLVELAKRLVVHHDFQVTFIIPNDGSSIKPQEQVLQSLPESISSIFLPPVCFEDFPEDVKMETKIPLYIARSLSPLRDSLKVLTESASSSRLVAVVFDLFGMVAFDAVKELGCSPYMFFSTTAMTLSLIFHLPELDKKFTCEYRDLPGPVRLPGCVPVHGGDLLNSIQDRTNEAYKFVIHRAKQYPLAAGIIINSCMGLESGALEALVEGEPGPDYGRCPVYPVGPLIQSSSNNLTLVDDSDCLKWLDKQPSGSVLFVSFGSGGTLSQEQLNELASGLELSGQRFLWVVRSPNEKAANGSYLTVESSNDPFDFLPIGFLDRTKERGLVVPSWAPQIQVLSHGSTGGFLSHCGWNSALESIVHGVPMIVWPLYAEQRMNAVLLAEDLKVALRVKVSENGLVGRNDIAKYAKGLMEGENGKLLKQKMSELKDATTIDLSPNGSSTKSLAKVAEILKNQK